MTPTPTPEPSIDTLLDRIENSLTQSNSLAGTILSRMGGHEKTHDTQHTHGGCASRI